MKCSVASSSFKHVQIGEYNFSHANGKHAEKVARVKETLPVVVFCSKTTLTLQDVSTEQFLNLFFRNRCSAFLAPTSDNQFSVFFCFRGIFGLLIRYLGQISFALHQLSSTC